MTMMMMSMMMMMTMMSRMMMMRMIFHPPVVATAGSFVLRVGQWGRLGRLKVQKDILWNTFIGRGANMPRYRMWHITGPRDCHRKYKHEKGRSAWVPSELGPCDKGKSSCENARPPATVQAKMAPMRNLHARRSPPDAG